MKYLYFIVTLLMINSNIKCNGIKKGTFVSRDENTGTTVIQRNDTIQLEENKKLGTIFLQKIKWVNDCEYIIYDTKTIRDDINLDMSKKTFKVTFKESKNNIYNISVLIEPANFNFDMSVEKISDDVGKDFYKRVKEYTKKD